MRSILTDTNSCIFRVWAPEKKTMTLHLLRKGDAEQSIDMQQDDQGYFLLEVPDLAAGDRYYYQPDGGDRYPDPCSAFQPQGVHGPSELVDQRAYAWQDTAWRGLPFEDLILYEVHVGAFSKEGTFEAMIPFLDDLVATGINAIELMPVAQCPGSRNWGYDGVFLYAIQNSYGGPDGLKKLVDACHRRGIAVYLDVVYNHLGREGNYLPFFGPYFSDKYHTPWGQALNFDGAWSDEVRNFIIENILYWGEYFHIDGLRLDAIHEIFDRNAIRIWDLLHERLKAWERRSGRRLYLVGESDLNSPRVINPPALGGYGLDAQWLDDFHHSLYVLLDPEGRRHYRDFGAIEQLAKSYTEGFVHSGEYVRFRQRSHGASSAGLTGDRFVVFNQNHDLPGNRPGGERLSMLVDLPRLRLAAAALLLAPYVPLLFMGEEYGEDAPFFFFSDYGDQAVIDSLRESRKKEFEAFEWGEDPPDSQDVEVFQRSGLHWDKREKGDHRILLEWHRSLIRLRKTHPLLRDLSRKYIRTDLLGPSALAVHRHSPDGTAQLLCLFNFCGQALSYPFSYRSDYEWIPLLSSGDGCRIGILPPWSMVVYSTAPS